MEKRRAQIRKENHLLVRVTVDSCHKAIRGVHYLKFSNTRNAVDEDESDRRKGDCLDDMQFLEQQFSDLKEM